MQGEARYDREKLDDRPRKADLNSVWSRERLWFLPGVPVPMPGLLGIGRRLG